MIAVGLALGAACCWGVADFLAGLASRRVPVPNVLLLVESGGMVVILSVAIATGEPLPGERAIFLAAAAGLAGVLALGCFYRALALGTMSIVAPISATGVVLPVVVGVATGDDPSPVAAAGLLLAVAGVVLASRESGHVDEESRSGRQALLLAVLAAIGFGTYFVCVDPAVEESVVWTLTIGRAVGVPPVIAVILLRSRAANPGIGWRLGLGLCAVGCVDLLATTLLALANNEGDVSIVSVMGALYPVMTVILAWIVLRERLARIQAAGVACALAGVLMVAGG